MPHHNDDRNGQRPRPVRDNDAAGERQAYGHDYDRDYTRGGSTYGRGYGDYASGMNAGREYGTSTNYGRELDRDSGGGTRYGQGRADYGSDRDYQDRLDRSKYGQSSGSDGSFGGERGAQWRGGGSYAGTQAQRGYRGEQDYASDRGDAAAATALNSHRGRGPKGYSRSDERIKEDISERLSDDHSIDASDITVEVTAGTVTLTGTVDERRLKHRAEDIADAVSGVKDVQNRLGVASSSQRADLKTGAAGTLDRGTDTTPKH